MKNYIVLVSLTFAIEWIFGAVVGNPFREMKSMPFRRYRDLWESRMDDTYQNFRKRTDIMTVDAEAEVEKYRLRIDALWDDAKVQRRQQQQVLRELSGRIAEFERRSRLDTSMKDFRRRYNGSMELIQSLTAHPQPSSSSTRPSFLRTKEKIPNFQLSRQDFTRYVDELSEQLRAQWRSGKSSFTTPIGLSKTASTMRSDAKQEIHRFQEELMSNANMISVNARTAIDLAISRRDMRQEANALEAQLRSLELEGRSWLKTRVRVLDMTLKALQMNIRATNMVYEELLDKRRSSMYYSAVNDAMLNKVLNFCDPNDSGWEQVRSAHGVTVHRKVPLGSRYAVIRAHGLINASASDIVALFDDNSRVHEYNKFFRTGRDLEMVSEDTKVVWACAPPIFPFKPRDFCTVVHYRRYEDGTTIVLNHATTHRDAQPTSEYVRGAILLGANIIEPIPGMKGQCRFTMLTQLDPGGFSPPVVVNQIASQGPVEFFGDLQKCARRPLKKKA